MVVTKYRNAVRIFFLVMFVVSSWSGYASISSQANEYLRKARVFFSRGSLIEARDYYLRARKIEPESADIQQAGQEIETAIKKKTDELQRQAEFFLNAKNVPEAEKILKQLLVLSPDNGFGKEKLAEVRKINEQIDEYLNKGIVVDPSSGRSHDIDLYSAISLLNRARGFYDNGDRVKALELVEQVLKREPGNKIALELKDKILHVNRIQEFIDSAETAFQQGKMRDSIDSLNRLIQELPDRHEFLLLRAKAHLKLNQHQEAKRDFWAYFAIYPDQRKVLFPYFSELYYDMNRYDLAMGFAKDSQTGENYQTLSFQYHSMFRFYVFEYIVLMVVMLVIPVIIYIAYCRFDHLVTRFPPGKFNLGTQLLLSMLISGPEKYLPLLIEVARSLNTPWLNYYAGICLFRVGQIEGAQRFLAYSFSNGYIAGRAYYFFGLTRKLLGQENSEHDFDASIVASMAKNTRGWHPKFMKRIEREILSGYSKVQDLETYEGMAWHLVAAQVGENS